MICKKNSEQFFDPSHPVLVQSVSNQMLSCRACRKQLASVEHEMFVLRVLVMSAV